MFLQSAITRDEIKIKYVMQIFKKKSDVALPLPQPVRFVMS